MPLSEIICFVSMVFTSLYLVVGTISNFQVKPQQDVIPKTITLEQVGSVNNNPNKSYNYYISINTIKKSNSHPLIEFADICCNSFKIINSCFWQHLFDSSFSPVSDFTYISTTRGPPIM